jgi:hypothetical protein
MLVLQRAGDVWKERTVAAEGAYRTHLLRRLRGPTRRGARPAREFVNDPFEAQDRRSLEIVPMATITRRIGPADHGRRMTLDEFIAADFEEGWLYELARG